MKINTIIKTTFLVLLLTAVTFGVVSAAGSIVLNGFTVEFLGVEMNGNTGTFTYAVTADPTVNPVPHGLSHWIIGTGNCSEINFVYPVTSGPYTSPIDSPVCSDGSHSCQAANYTEVEWGSDPTTGVFGIKFGDANSQQLSRENTGTHIFQIQIDNVVGTQDVQVGVKTNGRTGSTGLITGPLCRTPSAVALSTASAASNSPSLNISFLLITLLITLSSLTVWRRMRN